MWTRLKQLIARLLALPLWPLRPLGFLFQEEGRTARTLSRVLRWVGAGGLLFSFLAALFLAGLFLKRVRDAFGHSDPVLYILIAASMIPFIGLSLMHWAAARTLQPLGERPISATPGFGAGFERSVQLYFISVALVVLTLGLNLSAAALVVVGSVLAILASCLFLFLTVFLVVLTFGSVLSKWPNFWETIVAIWNGLTAPRLIFELEGRLLDSLQVDGGLVMIVALAYLYLPATVIAAWVLVQRKSWRADTAQLVP